MGVNNINEEGVENCVDIDGGSKLGGDKNYD